MVETGNDTGIFAGSIRLVSTGGTIEFSQIQAAVGDTLLISYFDTTTVDGTTKQVSDTATVTEVVTGNITGRVTNAATGDGINGATVTVESTGQQGTTASVQGQDGIYVIQGVPVGAQTLAVAANGFTSKSEDVTVVAGANVFNFALETGGTPTPTPTGSPTPTPTPSDFGNIAGRVTDAGTGAGINGATVTVESTGQTGTTTSVQGQDGVYAIQDVPIGAQTLTAEAVGFATSSQGVTVVTGNPNPGTGANFFSFALTGGTPTPTPTPTPCVPVEMTAAPKPLKIVREQSVEETVTVVCGDDAPSVNRLVQATITSGKKRITVSPASALTDANGQAKFTITATTKTGNARVKFQDATRPEVKTNVNVKVKKKNGTPTPTPTVSPTPTPVPG
jgi:hypothetical protein